MPNIVEYTDKDGKNSYREQYSEIKDKVGRAQITAAIYKMQYGNLGNVEPCGDGVYEYRILAKGPGYRIYFGKEGDHMIVLLGVGSKKNQPNDIANAKTVWKEYETVKKESQRK